MSTGRIYLDAVLEPPRSLSPRGFNRLMLGFGGFSFGVGLIFMLSGAWPVFGFMGLEVLLLWLVFRANFRAQTARTYVRVTADSVDVRKVDSRGRERRAQLSSHFARVVFDRAAQGAHGLRLAASNRSYPIGEFLTLPERETLAQRLGQALAAARAERYGDSDDH